MTKHINKQGKRSNISTYLLIGVCALSLSACSAAERLSKVGAAPNMSKIENPAVALGNKRVEMPMPEPVIENREANSLWSTGRQAFFKDQRASEIGDILTVVINIEDEAEMTNTTSRTRSSNEDAQLPALLGWEQDLGKYLPEAIDNNDLTEFSSTSNASGDGSTEREEEIDVKVAAVVTHVLPNGNMVIQGRQEVRVNFEKRVLEVAGVIRPQDISINNTISYEQIAEARIAYGGEGQITDMQQPRYGQQIYDILFPF
jgi:flagellar L-ring protein precursor FlgH